MMPAPHTVSPPHRVGDNAPHDMCLGWGSRGRTKWGSTPVIRLISQGVRASPKLARLGIRHQNAGIEGLSRCAVIGPNPRQAAARCAGCPGGFSHRSLPSSNTSGTRGGWRDLGIDPDELAPVPCPGEGAENIELGKASQAAAPPDTSQCRRRERPSRGLAPRHRSSEGRETEGDTYSRPKPANPGTSPSGPATATPAERCDRPPAMNGRPPRIRSPAWCGH